MYPRRIVTDVASIPTRGDTAAIRPRDSRAVLLAVFALVTAALVTVHGAVSMLGLLGFVCAWHVVVTGDLSTSAASLRRVAPFAVVVVLLNAIFGPGAPIVTLGGVRIMTDDGLANGVFFALRLAVMLMSVSLLLAAAAPEGLACGIYDVVRRVSKRAAGNVALFVFLAMGFVPLVADEFRRIRLAQSFRGGDLSGGLLSRAGAVRLSLVPLLVAAIRRSGQLAMAVELRDVRHRLPLTIEPPRLGGADVALLLTSGAAISAASGWLG
ncbi:MAG: energy-coupling factor transporter transmembrane protein EcfT [Candidatus Krumholzibacteria bacterium]|nr:energy-coupling factor transporter transmembrane protein EcfT [Candidatus Krumholzibacteria bacterium]MDH4336549.1 energy-coupling factor transporter transmembrane protein EcfT [Candidatus Krumholzibacteria bacterium]MDH5269630.1 energy-coupling factor transporter transmembrane protein EcfT [Candidatus Krumholzibacteria bacterium]